MAMDFVLSAAVARGRNELDIRILKKLFCGGIRKMKQSERISYEKPTLSQYGFFGVADGAPSGGLSSGGDIDEGCDSSFDE